MAMTVRLDKSTETALRELAEAEGISLDDALQCAINEQHVRTFQVGRITAGAERTERRFAGLLERLAAAPDAEDRSAQD